MMKIVPSQINDLPAILKIYEHARQMMKINGNPNQWKNISPETSDVISDINQGIHYSIWNDKEIVGVFTLLNEDDPCYRYIEGKWLNDEKYKTIHKIASLNKVKGILLEAINFALKDVSNIRIDTHQDNKIMLHLLEKYGFKRCGIIYLKNKEARIAFQYVKE